MLLLPALSYFFMASFFVQIGMEADAADGSEESKKVAQSTDSTSAGDHMSSTVPAGAAQEEEKSKDEEEEDVPLTEEEVERQTAGMTDVQKRLFKIRMKMNQGRKANKDEAEKEYKRASDPKFAKWEYAAERSEKNKEFGGDVKGAGEGAREQHTKVCCICSNDMMCLCL